MNHSRAESQRFQDKSDGTRLVFKTSNQTFNFDYVLDGNSENGRF